MTEAEALAILDKIQEGMNKLYDENVKLRAALQPFADMAQYVDSPMYTQDRYVAGLNTVEHYHEARRVLGEVTG